MGEHTNRKICAVVTSSHAIHSQSGASLRLSSVINVLELAGFEVDVFTAGTLKAIQKQKKYDLGVIVSFAQLRSYFTIKQVCSSIWLDSTDSLFQTRLLGLGRFRFFSYLNGFCEIVLALLLKRKFVCVTYISKRDKNFDSFLFQNTLKYVFPNPRLESSGLVNQSSEATIYFVGDNAYNANRKAIKFIERHMKKTPLKSKNGITIVSNKKNRKLKKHFRNGNFLTYRHSVPSKELYSDNSIHIVPIWNAVGIKNKIVEPASIGLRVVAGAPSFNGLILNEHMTPVFHKSEFFRTLNEILNDDFRRENSTASVIETDQTLDLVEFLRKNFKESDLGTQ